MVAHPSHATQSLEPLQARTTPAEFIDFPAPHPPSSLSFSLTVFSFTLPSLPHSSRATFHQKIRDVAPKLIPHSKEREREKGLLASLRPASPALPHSFCVHKMRAVFADESQSAAVGPPD